MGTKTTGITGVTVTTRPRLTTTGTVMLTRTCCPWRKPTGR